MDTPPKKMERWQVSTGKDLHHVSWGKQRLEGLLKEAKTKEPAPLNAEHRLMGGLSVMATGDSKLGRGDKPHQL